MHPELKKEMIMTAVQMNNLWAYLNGMALPLTDRKWLADKLLEPTAEPVAKTSKLDAALSKFHADWGGNGSAMEIAEELRCGSNTRVVDTW